jgi:hypothetical protein
VCGGVEGKVASDFWGVEGKVGIRGSIRFEIFMRLLILTLDIMQEGFNHP